MSTNDPRGDRGEETADWRSSPVPPPQPDGDSEATQAATPAPRSIHEETTLDAAQFVRPQQPPAAPPSQPWPGSPPPGSWQGGRQPAGPGGYPPHQTAPPTSPPWGAPPPGAGGYPPIQPKQRRGLTGLLADRRRWWVIGGAAAAVVVVVVALVVATSGDDSASTTGATATSPAQVPAGPTTTPRGATPAPPPPTPTVAPPPPPVVDAAALPGLLLPADQINQRMNTTGMTAKPPLNELLPGAITPPHCAGTWGPAHESTYNGSGYTALAVQGFFNPPRQLVQAVVAFPDAGAAKAFFDRQVADWNACKSTHIRFEHGGVTEVDLGVPAVTGDTMSLMLVPTTSQTAGQQCDRDIVVRSNVIVDVRACSPTVGSAGMSIAQEIAEKVGRTP